MVVGNGSVPRPEEERLTLAEKSERLNQQLKVSFPCKVNVCDSFENFHYETSV